MLKFEFVQPGEFVEPRYDIYYECNEIGVIEFHDGKWYAGLNESHFVRGSILVQMSEKLAELNKSTQSQRILGVF